MNYLLKSRRSDTTEKTSTSEEQRAKINEVRELLGTLSTEMPDFLSDATISRFLRARNWNTQKASKTLKEAVKWRRENKPETIRWEDVAHEPQTGHMYRADYLDKYGRSVLVARPALQNTTSGKEQIRYLVYCLENATMNSREGQEQIVWLADFRGWTLASTPLALSREAIHIIQHYYPERLGLGILYNPPRIFESFWKIIKHFMEPKMSEMAKFVYSDNLESQKIMADIFDMDKLESVFGGRNLDGFDINKYAERMRKDDKKKEGLMSSIDDLSRHE